MALVLVPDLEWCSAGTVKNSRNCRTVHSPGRMACVRILFIYLFIFCQILSCGYAESTTCTPGFESELFVFKVHRDHLHRGEILGRGRLFSHLIKILKQTNVV